MRKVQYITSLVLICVVWLSACQAGQVVERPEIEETVTVTYYRRGYVDGGTDVASVSTRQAIDKFMLNNPQIKVEMVGIPWTDEGTAKLEAALITQQDVNLIAIAGPSLPGYVKRGLISPAQDFMSAEDKQDFYPGALQASSVDGKVYAWPLWVTAVAVYANTEIFAERGVTLPTLEDPWTYDEFIVAAQQLTFQREDGTKVFAFSTPSIPGMFGFLPMLYMDGGRVLSEDGKKFIQNQPDAVSALQKIADLSLVYKVTPPDYGAVDQKTVVDQFMQRRSVAMIMETPATLATLEAADFPLAVLPPPVGKLGTPVTTGAFGMFAVIDVKDDVQEQAAHLLAQYLTSTQVSKDVADWQRAPGIRKSNDTYATTPGREIIVQLVAFGIYEVPVAIPGEVDSLYGAALQEILLGEKTAQEAMDDIQPVYQAALDDPQ
ncbi:MAG: hypothetical protein CVU39_09520 [Chloroflexi bacterium HGW-Chloroflexi-10]|nr:MAG: hypothetical protein CVU39_09520 [Chloroflexi bacterium HGW-Chloroflexi-10]